MDRLGLDGRLRDVAVGRLSAGQRRRASLAVVVARRPELWLLDEPHAGLDADGPRPGRRAGRARPAAAGATVLLASHELDRGQALSPAGRHHGRWRRGGRRGRTRPRRAAGRDRRCPMLRDAALVAGKDLRLEVRSRVGLNQVVPFAVLVLVLFAFALDPDRGVLDGPRPACSGWPCCSASLLAVQRSLSWRPPTGPATPCGCRACRPGRHLPRQGRAPSSCSCWCWRWCSASASRCSTTPQLAGWPSWSPPPCPRPSGSPRPVPSTACWPPGSGSVRRCCRSCSCRCSHRC